jgi:hypothetical protein
MSHYAIIGLVAFRPVFARDGRRWLSCETENTERAAPRYRWNVALLRTPARKEEPQDRAFACTPHSAGGSVQQTQDHSTSSALTFSLPTTAMRLNS